MAEDLNRAVQKEDGKVTFSKCQDAAIAAPALRAAAAAAAPWALLRDTLHTTPPAAEGRADQRQHSPDSSSSTLVQSSAWRSPCCKAPAASAPSCQDLGSVYKNLVVLHPADVFQNCPGIYTLFPFRNKSGFSDGSSPAGAAAGWMCCH